MLWKNAAICGSRCFHALPVVVAFHEVDGLPGHGLASGEKAVVLDAGAYHSKKYLPPSGVDRRILAWTATPRRPQSVHPCILSTKMPLHSISLSKMCLSKERAQSAAGRGTSSKECWDPGEEAEATWEAE